MIDLGYTTYTYVPKTHWAVCLLLKIIKWLTGTCLTALLPIFFYCGIMDLWVPAIIFAIGTMLLVFGTVGGKVITNCPKHHINGGGGSGRTYDGGSVNTTAYMDGSGDGGSCDGGC